ncbi:Hypothetical protein CINCED_3A003840 [Cinara cedri]|uniref:Uncharacterized protein n=1 Tax=Cinara cedri TaxID=506608 RepID=A0A5E4MCA7_9HEMI|nr:Hypothetical protein CINCED_3A003840 [Cinara cedri]
MRSYSLTRRVTKIIVLFIVALIVIQQASCIPMPGKNKKKNDSEYKKDHSAGHSHNNHSHTDYQGSTYYTNGDAQWDSHGRRVGNDKKSGHHERYQTPQEGGSFVGFEYDASNF